MIPLTKSPEPEVLQRNGRAWTEELVRKIAAGEEPSTYLLSRYAHPEIKAALLAETSEKCAYCESPLRHAAYGDVEHIAPKALNPALRFQWTNLTIACDVCNTNKSNNAGIFDPYTSDPNEAFKFVGPLIWPRINDDCAMLTEAQLELNRPRLIERRSERLEFLRNLVASAHQRPADVREAILRKAHSEVGNDKPFSGCTKAAIGALEALLA